MIKNYIQIKGLCKDCTLYAQCKDNQNNIKAFLAAKKMYCRDSLIVTVK